MSKYSGWKISKVQMNWAATSGRVNLQLDLNGKVVFLQAYNLNSGTMATSVAAQPKLKKSNTFGVSSSGAITLKDVTVEITK